jgi:hypothetical protein
LGDSANIAGLRNMWGLSVPKTTISGADSE